MDDARAPILAEISGLRKLTLCDPTRAILHILPDWLDRLSNSLTELHLKVDIPLFPLLQVVLNYLFTHRTIVDP